MRTPSSDMPHSAALRTPVLAALEPVGSGGEFEEYVSTASLGLRALAALSGSLTDALAPEDAADLVERQALSAIGATSAVIVTRGHFPPLAPPRSEEAAQPGATRLHVVHTVGLPAEIKAALDELPLDAAVPLAEVARLGDPLFMHSEEEMRRYPDWSDAVIAAGARAAAIVPVWANGELRGVLGLTWPAPRSFDEDERAFVLTLGVMCAQAIMRAHLHAAERQAREAAEQSNRSKAQFVATISHELRTPMHALLGYTDLIADEVYGPVTPVQKEHLQRVHDSGSHLLGLIEDLLSYARVEVGEEIVRAETVLLSDVVEESLVLVRPMAMKQRLRIRIEGPAQPVELHTDPRKLRQILVNLLANAVKFTDQGDVVLLLRLQGHHAEVRVIFEVTDSGRGIARVDHEHIFEPFWQVDPTSTKSAGSSGLGLSVARQLARLLGGDVCVARSALGEGSTFIVSLPVRYTGSAAPVG